MDVYMGLILTQSLGYVHSPYNDAIAVMPFVIALCVWYIHRKAEEGLQKVWREESGTGTLSLPANTNLMAYGKYKSKPFILCFTNQKK
jgi:hypothetical protein